MGDLYWCLTKLQSYRRRLDLGRVELVIQKTSKDRAIEWKDMVDFVDAAHYAHFIAPTEVKSGYRSPFRNYYAVMWPNTVVDRGERLESWMPEDEINLNFKIKTQFTRAPGDVVLFASSDATNRAWLPSCGINWWISLAKELANFTGRRPLLIGKGWDAAYGLELQQHVEAHVGHTTLPQVAGILENAACIVGVASGMTILGNHFRTPTIAFFPDKHHPHFPTSWVALDAPYMPLFHRELLRAYRPARIAQLAASLMATKRESRAAV